MPANFQKCPSVPLVDFQLSLAVVELVAELAAAPSDAGLPLGLTIFLTC